MSQLLRFLGCCFFATLAVESTAFQQQTSSVIAQADDAFKQGDYAKAKSLYKTAAEALTAGDSTEYRYILGLAESHFQLRAYDSAQSQYERLLTAPLYSKMKKKDQWKVQTRLGFTYRYVDRALKKALSTFEKEQTLIIALDTAVSATIRFANAYNLSTTYRLLENYEKALDYGFAALSHVQSDKDRSERNLILSYSVIANTLGDMKDFKQATEYHLKKIDLGESLYGSNQRQLADYYLNAAVDFNSAGDLEQAKKYFLKAQRSLGDSKRNKRLLASSHRGLSSIYRRNNEFSKARRHLDSAMLYSAGSAFQKASSSQFLTRYYLNINEYDSALWASQQAFSYSIPSFNWTKPEQNPTDDELLKDPFHYRLLNQKAAVWLSKYKADKDRFALEEAYKCYLIMDRLTEVYRSNFTLESSKLLFQNWNHSNYERALETLYLLYEASKDSRYISEAWLLMEKNKSLLLLEKLIKAEKRTMGGLTDSLQTRLAEASKSRWSIRSKLSTCRQKGLCDETSMIQMRAALAESESVIRKLEQSIQLKMPNYYNTAFGDVLLSMEEAAGRLSANQTIVNYFAANNDYFLITLDHDHSTFKRLSRTKESEEALAQFIQEVSGADKSMQRGVRASFERFTTSASTVYEYLIKDVIKTSEVKELVIIPDGILGLVPFEALIEEMPIGNTVDFLNLDYLIKKYKIGYGYSATLWFKNLEKVGLSQQARLIAFAAAQTNNRPDMVRLTGTQKEGNLLSKLPNANLYSEDEASEANFKKSAPEAEILHMALHNINDKRNPLNSHIIFNQSSESEDGNLHMFELYGLQMKPRLVVLSACETGVGDWKRGEGPYHMGRGFLYHGNPALIVSLWKVNDNSSASIMGSFYESLASGEDSGKSLTQAKLNYLNEADEYTAHPGNWAAFVNIGEVTMSKPLISKWYYLMFLVLIILIYLTKKRLSALRQ